MRRFFLLATLVLAVFAAIATLGRAEEFGGFDKPAAAHFVCPSAWSRDASPEGRRYSVGTVRRMLETGWADRADWRTRTDAQYDWAANCCREDVRLDYAFGLILAKHGKNDEALRLFEQASARPETPRYVPMMQAAAWIRLTQGDLDGGLRGLLALARFVGANDSEYPAPAQRRRAALFLGRVVGFLDGPGRRDDQTDAVADACAAIRAELPIELRRNFDAGFSEIAARQAELQKRADRPANEIVAEFETKKAALERRIEDSRGGFHENLTETRVAAGLLAEERRRLQTANTAVAANADPRTYTDYRQERDRTDQRRGRRASTGKFVTRGENETERRIRLAHYERAQDEARQIGSQIAELEKQIRTNPVALRKVDDELTRADAELKALVKNYASPEQRRAAVTSLAAYVPWDLDAERDALLASFELKAISGAR